jgi:MFS family permease
MRATSSPSRSRAETSPAAGKSSLLVVVCLAQFMVILDVSIVNVALPEIHNGLGFSTTGLQWVVNAYTLTFAGFLMLGGRCADLLGRRRVFLAGTALFSVSSLVCALASTRGLLIGARALQGFGGAILSPATLSIITTSFAAGPARNRALGMWGAVGALGASSGALLGGLLTQGFGWPAIFAVNVPLGVIVVVLGLRWIPADDDAADVLPEAATADAGPAAGGAGVRPDGGRPRRGRLSLGARRGRFSLGARTRARVQRPDGTAPRAFDIAGAVLVTGGLVALTFGIVRTDTLGWGAAGVLFPLAAGLVLLAAFAYVEGRVARDPLIPLGVLRFGQLRVANGVVVLLYAAFFPVWFFLALYLQQVLHYDAIEAGLSFLPMTLSIFLASTFAPRLVARFGVPRVVTAGMLFATAGIALLAGIAPGDSYVSAVLPGAVISAIGMGLSLVPATIAAVHCLPQSQSGLGSGLLNTSRLMGGALGLAVLSTIADAQTRAHAGAGAAHALTDGFDLAFALGAGLCLFGAVLAALLLRNPSQASAPTDAPHADPAESRSADRAATSEGEALVA